MKYEAKQIKDEADKIRVITEYIELAGTLANPPAGMKWRELKELRKAQQEITPESFEAEWEDLKKAIPEVLSVRYTDNKKADVLPAYERKSKKPKSTPGIKKRK